MKESDARKLTPPTNARRPFVHKNDDVTKYKKKAESLVNRFQNTRTRQKERGILCWRLLLIGNTLTLVKLPLLMLHDPGWNQISVIFELL